MVLIRRKGAKSKQDTTRRTKKWLPIIVTSAIALLVSTALAFMVFRYQINPDGISYINIAERYAALDFSNALNGYWGVLISWLLVPFIWVGADPVISFYIVSTLCSIATVLIFHWFVQKKGIVIKALPLYIIELTLLLILVSFSLSVLTPDILLTLMLLIVLVAFVSFDGNPTLKNGILLGLAGAFLYFAKPAGLLLFVFALVVYAVFSIVRAKKWSKLLLIPLITFAVLVVPYCVALSNKYHQITFSTSSAYNLSLISPTYQRRHTITLPGIYLPPSKYATSVWDDPSVLPIVSWHPLKTAADIKYYTNEILQNVHTIATYMGNLGIAFVVGLSVLVTTAALRKRYMLEAFIATVLVVGVLGLYAVSVVEPRHLWPLIPLSFLGILLLLDNLKGKSPLLSRVPLYISIAVLFISAAFITPVNTGDITPPYKDVANSLSKYVKPGDRVISDDAGMMYTCYALDIQCAGILPTKTDQKSIDFLRQNNVQYLFLNDPKPYESIIDKYYTTIDSELHLYILR